MLLLFDECTNKRLVEIFVSRGHEVVFAVDLVAASSPDIVVARTADNMGAIVVTWNYKHFKPLFHRGGGSPEFPRMGLIGFRCPQIDGPRHLMERIHLIEAAYAHTQSTQGRRLHVMIAHNHFECF
jgi:hypothetical protein